MGKSVLVVVYKTTRGMDDHWRARMAYEKNANPGCSLMRRRRVHEKSPAKNRNENAQGLRADS